MAPIVYSVGLVGYGRWGKIFAKEIRSCERLSLRGICYPSSSPDNSHTYSSLDKMLSSVALDAVVIAAPLKCRYQLIYKSLLANKSVLAEKPLAESADDADHLAKIAGDRNLVLYTNYVHAYSQGVKYAIKHLKSLGKLELISIIMNQPGPMYSQEDPISLLGSHGFAIAMKSIVGDSCSIEFNLRNCFRSSGLNMALIQGHFPAYNVDFNLAVNIAHPLRQRAIDYVTSKGSISVQLAGPLSGSWTSLLPSSLSDNNTVPITSTKQLDEMRNIQNVFVRFISTLDGAANGNILLAQSVQRALDACTNNS